MYFVALFQGVLSLFIGIVSDYSLEYVICFTQIEKPDTMSIFYTELPLILVNKCSDVFKSLLQLLEEWSYHFMCSMKLIW